MHTTALLSLLLATTAADAQSTLVSPERPSLPSMSTAGEDGAVILWSTPANLAFDQDPSAWLAWEQRLSGGPGTFSAALQRGPLGVGVLYRNGATEQGWLSLTDGLGIRLGRRVALGVASGWQIPEGPQNNFLTWDVSLGWRPAQWLGVSLLAQNLNNPAEDMGVRQLFGGGIAWRPWGDRILLGVDYSQPDLAPDVTGAFRASARLQPVDGLVVRVSGDQTGTVGAGLEVYWGRTGVGLHGTSAPDDLSEFRGMSYVITGDGDNDLFKRGRLMPEFVLDSSFPYQSRGGLFSSSGETWLHLITRVQEAIDDPQVEGFVLHINQAPGSWARVQELRDLLAEARSRGKLTVAYLDRDTSNAAYFAAVAADRVYLHPAATLDLVGLSMELRYLRGTLDLVGIQPQYVKRSEYKSAPEQWTRTTPSAAAREQLNALLDDLSGELRQAVAQGRAQDPDQVSELVDAGPFAADDAQARGLVDGLAYPDQLEGTLQTAFRRRLKLDRDYRLDDEVSGWPAAREIAIIYVDGVIVTGSSSPGGLLSGKTTGSDTVIRQLEQARREDAVEAVVLRVDSPGGSAFASDEIWRETQRLREAGKPLIVSMGGVAASGGYYVSAGADLIYAEPGTITGSIGVYSGKFNAARLYDTLGVSTEILSRGRNASMYSMSRALDEEELETMDRLVGVTYDQFKARVAEGRPLSLDEVEERARGRVWSGVQAQQQGLVDELGGLSAAIEAARREAGLRDSSTVELVTYTDRPGSPISRRVLRTLSSAWPEDDGVLATTLASWSQPPEHGLARDLAQLGTLSRLADEPVWVLLPWGLDVR